jgi:membrane protein implicated in regulation of membrane protease activity
MWLQLGLLGGALLVAAVLVRRFVRRRSSRAIDVGPVSDAWLAEQRSRRHDGL